MTSKPIDEELFCFDDDEAFEQSVAAEPWWILLVDDDDAVLKVSQLVFKGMIIDGAPVQLLFAQSAETARLRLQEHPDISVAVIDVVMEDEAAGLRLVRWIREQPNLQKLRLVLRTGQPGQSPAADVLKAYDINDYWPKTEISAARSQALLTGLVRSYRDLKALEIQRRQLDNALKTLSSMMYSAQDTESILRALADGLSSLNIPPRPPPLSLYSLETDEHAFTSLSVQFSLNGSPSMEYAALLKESWETHQMVRRPDFFVLCHQSDGGRGLGLVVEATAPEDPAALDTLLLLTLSALSFLQVRLVLEEEREILRSVDRFVPHDLIRAIGHDSVQTLRAGDYVLSTRWVLFADIEGFTTLSESLGLVEIRDALMNVLQTIIPYVTAAGGIIEKFMGDGFLALFPCDGPPPIDCCLDALEEIRRRNADWQASGLPELSMSLTLVGGPVLLCTLGDGVRLDITAVSDTVNTCARLQSHARLYRSRFLVTDGVYEAALDDDRARMRPLGDVALRGRRGRVFLYDVLGRDVDGVLPAEQLSALRRRIVDQGALSPEEQAELLEAFPNDRVLHAALAAWAATGGG